VVQNGSLVDDDHRRRRHGSLGYQRLSSGRSAEDEILSWLARLDQLELQGQIGAVDEIRLSSATIGRRTN